MCRGLGNINSSFTTDIKNDGNNVSQNKVESTERSYGANVNVADSSEERCDNPNCVSISHDHIDIITIVVGGPGIGKSTVWKNILKFGVVAEASVKSVTEVMSVSEGTKRTTMSDKNNKRKITPSIIDTPGLVDCNEYINLSRRKIDFSCCAMGDLNLSRTLSDLNGSLRCLNQVRISDNHRKKELQQDFATKIQIMKKLKYYDTLKDSQNLQINVPFIDSDRSILTAAEGIESPLSLQSVKEAPRYALPLHKRQYKVYKLREQRKPKKMESRREEQLSDSSSCDEQSFFQQ